MLVLKRKVGETIAIEVPNGDTITIMLTDTNSYAAKIGIEAPKPYKILRTELVKKEETE